MNLCREIYLLCFIVFVTVPNTLAQYQRKVYNETNENVTEGVTHHELPTNNSVGVANYQPHSGRGNQSQTTHTPKNTLQNQHGNLSLQQEHQEEQEHQEQDEFPHQNEAVRQQHTDVGSADIKNTESAAEAQRSRDTLQDKSSSLCQPYIVGVGGNERMGRTKYGIRPHCLPPMERQGNICELRNNHVVVIDAKGLPWYLISQRLPVVSFNCSHGYHDATNGGFSPAIDAFRYTNDALSVLQSWYNISMADSLPIHVFVHVNTHLEDAKFMAKPRKSSLTFPGSRAFSFRMLLGDGRNRAPGASGIPRSFGHLSTFPFTTPNVIGHEIGHAVVLKTSWLEVSGEAGAIHEAFADMTGELLEFYVTGNVDWYVARNIYRLANKDDQNLSLGEQNQLDKNNDINNDVNIDNNSNEPIRNFFNPSLDGISCSHVRQFSPEMNPHQTSGIYRHVFYHAARELGVRATYEAFLHTTRFLWNSKSSLREGACDVLQAAEVTGSNKDVFINAFGKVGILTKDCYLSSDAGPKHKEIKATY